MAQGYSYEIGQLPQLEDPLAEMILEHSGGHAPSVSAGQPRDPIHVAKATNECSQLQLMRWHHANVTDSEIAAAELRKSKILVEHGAGPATIGALQELLADFKQDLRQEIAQQNQDLRQELARQNQNLRQELAQQNQNLRQELAQQNQELRQELSEKMTTLSAQVSNLDIKRFNRQAMKMQTEIYGTNRLQPLFKTKQGFGNGLPQYPPQHPPHAAVGDQIPEGLFPLTVGALDTFTHQQLSNISAWLNDDFGILPDETTIAPRLCKFRAYIS